jgi:hypothetical protein
MSWIKPNFLWMMYRSSWGQAEGQEVVLGLRIRRSFFDWLLSSAVFSSFDASRHASREQWQTAVAGSDVRLQWDPDHLPTGDKCERRAVQLGLRADALARFGRTELLEVIDMSPLVEEQRELASSWRDGRLQTPVETCYLPAEPGAAVNVGLSTSPPPGGVSVPASRELC